MPATATEPSRRALMIAAGSLGLAAVIGGAALWRLATPPPASAALAELGRRAGDVRVIGQDGREIVWGSLTGAPRAVFFGFTRCPEICPTTIAELDGAMALLGPAAEDLKVQFVTVDPARDTPDHLARYLSSFGPRFSGFTGTQREIERLAQAYRVRYRKVPITGDDYTMDHTALVYLIDREGRVRDFIAYGVGPERAAEQLRTFLGGT